LRTALDGPKICSMRCAKVLLIVLLFNAARQLAYAAIPRF
jgi:hypothetical protein